MKELGALWGDPFTYVLLELIGQGYKGREGTEEEDPDFVMVLATVPRPALVGKLILHRLHLH